MQQSSLIQRYRHATWKTWLAAALAAWLLLAESFAVAHRFDLAGHSKAQDCAVCVSVASFDAGAVSAPVHFEPTLAASFVVVAAASVSLSVVPTSRYARGPPAVSFV